MAKIAKVISSCNDCEFSRILKESNGNTRFALVCEYDNDPLEDNEDKKFEPFMINFFHDDPAHYANWIPKKCPLEDYTHDRE